MRPVGIIWRSWWVEELLQVLVELNQRELCPVKHVYKETCKHIIHRFCAKVVFNVVFSASYRRHCISYCFLVLSNLCQVWIEYNEHRILSNFYQPFLHVLYFYTFWNLTTFISIGQTSWNQFYAAWLYQNSASTGKKERSHSRQKLISRHGQFWGQLVSNKRGSFGHLAAWIYFVLK